MLQVPRPFPSLWRYEGSSAGTGEQWYSAESSSLNLGVHIQGAAGSLNTKMTHILSLCFTSVVSPTLAGYQDHVLAAPHTLLCVC